MKKIDNYFEQLITAFVVEYFKRTHIYEIERVNPEDKSALAIAFKSEENLGKFNCVNKKLLTIYPNTVKPHHLRVDEVWIGFDGDGPLWPDHMGGKDIDCTGMTFQSSIDHVIKEICHSIQSSDEVRVTPLFIFISN